MDSLTVGEQLLRLTVALVAGMVIGLEREWREKAAGFRTLALVSLGSALFTLYSFHIPSGEEVSRLAAAVITGVGFLGAGAILREKGEVLGLTTAAAVWVSAAVGMGAGFGAWALTLAGMLLALVVLTVLPLIDISRFANEQRIYRIVAESRAESLNVAGLIEAKGLKGQRHSVNRQGADLTTVWRVVGRAEQHRELTRALIDNEALSSVKITARPL